MSRLEADSFSSMNGIIMRHKVKFSIFALEKFSTSTEEDIEKRAVVALLLAFQLQLGALVHKRTDY